MFIVSFLGVKGKEKQTVGEVYDLFDSVTPIFLYFYFDHSHNDSQIASELWPIVDAANEHHSEDEDPDTELSLEAQIANEVSAMKRPRSQNPAQRFGKYFLLLFNSILLIFLKIANCQTNTPCGMHFRPSSLP